VGSGLLAGGFTNARMATDNGATATSGTTTSAHNANGAVGTVWGYGPISATANNGQAGVSLDCANCHDPHGKASSTHTATYRILRSKPKGVSVATGVDVPEQATKTYTVAAASYYGQSYTTNGTGVSVANWCSTCHTRYMSSDAGADSGDAVYKYRHISGSTNVNCLTCHVAHGSASHMTGIANSAGGQPGNTSATDSALLRLDNRGVCQACHQK
jgi:hypothetical protein